MMKSQSRLEGLRRGTRRRLLVLPFLAVVGIGGCMWFLHALSKAQGIPLARANVLMIGEAALGYLREHGTEPQDFACLLRDGWFYVSSDGECLRRRDTNARVSARWSESRCWFMSVTIVFPRVPATCKVVGETVVDFEGRRVVPIRIPDCPEHDIITQAQDDIARAWLALRLGESQGKE